MDGLPGQMCLLGDVASSDIQKKVGLFPAMCSGPWHLGPPEAVSPNKQLTLDPAGTHRPCLAREEPANSTRRWGNYAVKINKGRRNG
ncbi:hypothetical protein GN956_G14036 [Arapaima gigas]